MNHKPPRRCASQPQNAAQAGCLVCAQGSREAGWAGCSCGVQSPTAGTESKRGKVPQQPACYGGVHGNSLRLEFAGGPLKKKTNVDSDRGPGWAEPIFLRGFEVQGQKNCHHCQSRAPILSNCSTSLDLNFPAAAPEHQLCHRQPPLRETVYQGSSVPPVRPS